MSPFLLVQHEHFMYGYILCTKDKRLSGVRVQPPFKPYSIGNVSQARDDQALVCKLCPFSHARQSWHGSAGCLFSRAFRRGFRERSRVLLARISSIARGREPALLVVHCAWNRWHSYWPNLSSPFQKLIVFTWLKNQITMAGFCLSFTDMNKLIRWKNKLN